VKEALMADKIKDQTEDEKKSGAPTPADMPSKVEEDTSGEKSEAQSLEDWKAHARLWEDRAKANRAEADAAIAERDSAKRRIEQIESEQSKNSPVEALAAAARYKKAIEVGMTIEQADAVLTGSDEEAIASQAKAFQDAVNTAVKSKTEDATEKQGEMPADDEPSENPAERQEQKKVRDNPLQGSPASQKSDPEAMFKRLTRR
jgi:hypothetical protein